MKHLILIALFFSAQLNSSQVSTKVSCAGITDGHVYTAQANGTCAFEAAPGSAGGDAWGDPVDDNIIPDSADDTYTLGTSTDRFAESYVVDHFGTHLKLLAPDADETVLEIMSTADDVVRYRLSNNDSEQEYFAWTANFTAGNVLSLAGVTGGAGNTVYSIDRTNNTFTFGSAYNVRIDSASASTLASFDANKGLATVANVSATEAGYLDGVTSAIQTQINNIKVEDISGHIETVSNKTLYLRLNASYAYTVNQITVDCASGTADGELQIDGTPVTGCADANIDFTSTEETETCSAANVVSAGNDLTLVITDNSTALDCRFTVKTTRS